MSRDIGQRWGRLTLVSVKPVVFRCDCGKTVEGRGFYHVEKGNLRSCGCGQRVSKAIGGMEILRVLNPEEKVSYQRCKARCRRCKGEQEVLVSTARTAQIRGCKLCWRGLEPGWKEEQ